MNTPITDYVKQYAHSQNLRLHMPGHKGHTFLGIEKYDITEIDGADVLYNANGIIRQSQENAATLFETQKTLYSAEGSSLSLRAMLYLAFTYALHNGKNPKILAAANSHKTFVSAAALLDFKIEWMYGENPNGIVSCKITPEYLEKTLCQTSEKPCAVFITSPDYLGNIADIKGISEVCKKYGVLLLADNAHGAYLKFLPKNLHPIFLGADICCDSAHKTLPVLTGGGYLHISKNAPAEIAQNAEKAMSLFASTSPSYLILQSLDCANAYLSDNYPKKLFDFCKLVSELKNNLQTLGYTLLGSEPLKITFATKPYGYNGCEFAKILKKNNVICEFYDPDYTVLMPNLENPSNITETLYNILKRIPKRSEIKEPPPKISHSEFVMSPRQALLQKSVRLPVDECLNKVFTGINVACPPAIPIVVCGERITCTAIQALKYYGVEYCEVAAT